MPLSRSTSLKLTILSLLVVIHNASSLLSTSQETGLNAAAHPAYADVADPDFRLFRPPLLQEEPLDTPDEEEVASGALSRSDNSESQQHLAAAVDGLRQSSSRRVQNQGGVAGQWKLGCPKGCSGHGSCLEGSCVCDPLYKDPDCSDRKKPDGFKYPTITSQVEKWARGEKAETWKQLSICLVTCEVAGPVNNGGIGTAYTTLAQSLAAQGHKVFLLFTMGEVALDGRFSEWVRHYASQGIELQGLRKGPPGLKHIPQLMMQSYEVLLFLKNRTFDVVHFHDYQGAGYYSLLAKRQGLALRGTTTVVGVHGPTFWAKAAGNGEPIDQVKDLEGNFMEQKSIAWADYIVSPSQFILRWMETEGWASNPRTYVQPNLLPLATRYTTPTTTPRSPSPIKELVFFGRLETRKGVVIFCDAIDRLLGLSGANATSRYSPLVKIWGVEDEEGGGDDHRPELLKVTFLGRGAMVGGKFGVNYVQERAMAWGDKGLAWKVITRMGPQEAREYLSQGEGRLAVMPSMVENSPYTVYECAEWGIPFLAADVGGVRDLIHPEDRTQALVEPEAEALALRLVRALQEGVVAARPLVNASANEAAWLTWHQIIAREQRQADLKRLAELDARLAGPHRPLVTAVVTHYNRPPLCRQALESLEAQDYPKESMEVILLDDGSTSAESAQFLDSLEEPFEQRGWTISRQPNRYLGAARNSAARLAKGKYILFMDDDNFAKPNEVSTYVRAMEAGGADVMTSFVDFFWSNIDRPPSDPPMGEGYPSYIFLGGSSDVGAFKNCFGDANTFVRKRSFEAIGGYTEDYGVGYEDWEMYANATLRGFQVDVLPVAVYWYRFTEGSMQKTTDYFANRRRSLRPYLRSLPESVHGAILSTVFPERNDGTIGPPLGLAAEGDSKFHGITTPNGQPPPETSYQRLVAQT